jgi:hypothetical protein
MTLKQRVRFVSATCDVNPTHFRRHHVERSSILRHHDGRNERGDGVGHSWVGASSPSRKSLNMKRHLTGQSRRSILTFVHPPSPAPRLSPRQDLTRFSCNPPTSTNTTTNPIRLAPRRKCTRRSLSSTSGGGGGGGGVSALQAEGVSALQAEGAAASQSAAAAAEVVPEPSYAELRALAIATAVYVNEVQVIRTHARTPQYCQPFNDLVLVLCRLIKLTAFSCTFAGRSWASASWTMQFSLWQGTPSTRPWG